MNQDDTLPPRQLSVNIANSRNDTRRHSHSPVGTSVPWEAMKYTIVRQHSLLRNQFKIISNAKTVCTATVKSSDGDEGQYR